jgi:hypothetical protein
MNEDTIQHWPSWRYGPKGEAEIFEREADVPSGWEDHPAKFKEEGKDEAVAKSSEPNRPSEEATSPVKPSSKVKKTK